MSDKIDIFLLKACAALSLLCAAVAAFVVGERVAAAVWHWFKFYNYGGRGFISLSHATSHTFTIAVLSIAVLAFGLRIIAKGRGLNAASFQSGLAAVICISSVVVY